MLLAVSAAGWLVAVALDGRAMCGSGSSVAWGVMLLAMLPPLLAQPLRLIWRSSLARRRAAVSAAFLAGYGLVWMLAGGVLEAAAAGLAGWALPAVLAAAAMWRFTPVRAGAMTLCHRTPLLRAFGVAALGDGAGYGVRLGVGCVGACWPLMALPLATPGWRLPAMAAAAAAMAAERHWPRSASLDR